MRFHAPNLFNVGLALLPAILLGLLVPFLFVSPENEMFYRSYVTLLIAGGVTVSIYALTLAAMALLWAEVALKAVNALPDRYLWYNYPKVMIA